MSQYTNGPWTVDPECLADIRGADGGDVAIAICKPMQTIDIRAMTVGPATREQASINARLIAAAPELLEALIECLECEFAVTDKAAIKKALSAIAKATGESP